jgi:hypothetical protein
LRVMTPRLRPLRKPTRQSQTALDELLDRDLFPEVVEREAAAAPTPRTP